MRSMGRSCTMTRRGASRAATSRCRAASSAACGSWAKKPLRRVMEHLHGQRPVGAGALALRVVLQNGLMAGLGLRKAHRALDHGVKDPHLLAEGLTRILDRLPVDDGPLVNHREENPGDPQVRVEAAAAHELDLVQDEGD